VLALGARLKPRLFRSPRVFEARVYGPLHGHAKAGILIHEAAVPQYRVDAGRLIVALAENPADPPYGVRADSHLSCDLRASAARGFEVSHKLVIYAARPPALSHVPPQ
jgi:hypothetical protein